MYMRDWLKKLDDFIKLNDKPILVDSGTVSHDEMKQKVKAELEKYNRRIESKRALTEKDFKRALEETS